MTSQELRPNGQPGDEDQAAVLPLAGTSVVVTGTFQMKKLTRPEVKSLVESLGGRVASSVSSKTNLVVTGAKPGLSKLEDADRLGVPVIEEREFWRRVGQVKPPFPVSCLWAVAARCSS